MANLKSVAEYYCTRLKRMNNRHSVTALLEETTSLPEASPGPLGVVYLNQLGMVDPLT